MAPVRWLLPALAAGRLGSGVAAPAPTSRKEDTPQLSQDADHEDPGQYEEHSSFAFGYVAPALLPFAPPEDPHEDGLSVAGDGLSISSVEQESFAGLDMTSTTGLAFQCSLPVGLMPCATDFAYVKEGAQPVDAPNALPYKCYRTVVNENVHTLSVVALAAAAGAPTSQVEDRHTFAISVPAVAAEKTKAQYDAGTGAYSVKLFPAEDTASQPPVSFTQVASVGFTSFVPEPVVGPGLQSLASKAETLLGGGMREIRDGAP